MTHYYYNFETGEGRTEIVKNKGFIKQLKHIHNIFKTRRTYRRKEFYKRKIGIYYPPACGDTCKLELRVCRGEGDNKVIAALDFAARFQHYTVKDFD